MSLRYSGCGIPYGTSFHPGQRVGGEMSCLRRRLVEGLEGEAGF